jgi:hypothetical protein
MERVVLKARTLRRFTFASLGFATGCTLFVDLDRYDRGGPKSADPDGAAFDVRVDVITDVQIDVPRPPKLDGGAPPFDAAGIDAAACSCNGLAACCKAMADPYERQSCESEWEYAEPDEQDCCYALQFYRTAKLCP